MSLVLTPSLSLPTTDAPASKGAAVELTAVDGGTAPGSGDGTPAQSSAGAAALLVLGAALVGCGGFGWFWARRRRRASAQEPGRQKPGRQKRDRDDESVPRTIVVQGTDVSLAAPRGTTRFDDTQLSPGQSAPGQSGSRQSAPGQSAPKQSAPGEATVQSPRGAQDASSRPPQVAPAGKGPSSAPPFTVDRRGSSSPRGLGLKSAVDVDAGRYSLSSHAPSDGTGDGRHSSSAPPHSDPVPRAPRVPTEFSPPPLDPLPQAPEGPRTQRGLGIPSPPPGPLGDSTHHQPLTSASSRTVRGIGSLRSPSVAPPGGNPLNRTVRGIGPSEVLDALSHLSGGQLPGGQLPGADVREAPRLPPAGSASSGIAVGKETLKWGVSAPLFDEAGTPLARPPASPTSSIPTSSTLTSNTSSIPTSSTLTSNTSSIPGSGPWPGQQTTSASTPPARVISVQHIRPATLPRTKLATHLRGVARELLEPTTTSGRVVLLTAPPSDSDLLVRAAVELANHVGATCPGDVVLGETDFERPRLREWLGVEVPFGKGLSEQIHGVVRTGQSGPWTVMDAELGFHLLLEGRIRSPGLLWSQEFPEVIDALRRRYRLVLLVAPARPSSVDEQALRDVCDAALAISAEGTSEKIRAAHWRHLEDKVIRTLRLPAAG